MDKLHQATAQIYPYEQWCPDCAGWHDGFRCKYCRAMANIEIITTPDKFEKKVDGKPKVS